MMPQSMCLVFVMRIDSIPNFQAQQNLIGAVWTHPPMFLGTRTKQILHQSRDLVGGLRKAFPINDQAERSFLKAYPLKFSGQTMLCP